MKGKGRLKIWAGGVMIALMAASSVPLTASAEEYISVSNNTEFIIKGDTCGSNCQGHKIVGTSQGGSTYIYVDGGTHTITLSGVTLTAKSGKAAIELSGNNTSVNLILESENKLTGADGCAGILVPDGASLNVSGNGSLTTTAGGGDAAGIGGQGSGYSASAGNITIKSGDIIATGAGSGAGIGGATSGSAGTIVISGGNVKSTGGEEGGNGIGCGGKKGSGGSITIENTTQTNTTVLAKGGDTLEGSETAAGTGIGCGPTGSNVNVTIKGGESIEAVGGTNVDSGKQQPGILCTELSSGGSASVVIKTNKLSAKKTSDFSGLVWTEPNTDEDGNTDYYTCEVYGETRLPDSITQIAKDHTLLVQEGATLIIPTTHDTLTIYGTITGGGTVINADKYVRATGGTDSIAAANKKVELLAKDIHINQNLLVYTGDDLADTAITIDATRSGTSFAVDRTGWIRWINNEENGKMIDVGSYLVEFRRDGYSTIWANEITSGVNQALTVSPRPLSDVTVGDLPARYYDGTSDAPDLTLTYNGMTLKQGTDYTIAYINANTGETLSSAPSAIGNYKIRMTGKGNYTGERDVDYNIVRALIDESMVTFDFDKTYNGKDRRDDGTLSENITIQIGSTKLKENTDYTLAYSADYIKNIGSYSVTITGINNYTGEVVENFKITPKTLEIESIDVPKSRPYDGTNEIEIQGVELDGVCGDDDVEVDLDVIEGTISGKNVNASNYEKVTLNNIVLKGNDSGNYEITDNTQITLDKSFEITAADPGYFGLAVEYTLDSKTETYTCTVTIVPEEGKELAPGIMYQFRKGNGILGTGLGNWDTDNGTDTSIEYSGLTPGKTYTFQAKAQDNANWVQRNDKGVTDEIAEIEVTLPKLSQEMPDAFSVIYELSEEPDEMGVYTFTATIPKVDGCEYSFNRTSSMDADEGWSSDNVMTDLLAGDPCIGYIRYKEDSTHEASDARASSNETVPDLIAVAPEVTSNGGGTSFVNTTKITMSSETVGASIYYTTDGTEPATSETGSTKLYEESFEIGKSMTIKAIATKKGMEKSDTTTVSFTMIEGTLMPNIEIDVNGETVTFRRYITSGISEVPDTLKEAGYETTDSIIAALQNKLIGSFAGEGYNYLNMKFYEINLMRLDGDTWVPVTEEYFPEEGIPFEISYPDGTGGDTNDFVVAHMFTENTERKTSAEDTLESVNVKAGNIEIPRNIQTLSKSLQFTVHGTSPVAVAWKSNGNTTEDPSDGSTDDNNNSSGATNTTNNGNNSTGSTTTDDDSSGTPATASYSGSGTGTSGTGTTGTTGGTTATTEAETANSTEGTEAETGSGVISSIMPDTGDPSSFIPWIVLIVLSVGIIIGVAIKRRRG